MFFSKGIYRVIPCSQKMQSTFDNNIPTIRKLLICHAVSLVIPMTNNTLSESIIQINWEDKMMEVRNKCALVAYLRALSDLLNMPMTVAFVNGIIADIAMIRGTEKYHTLVPPKSTYNPETQMLNEPSYENLSFFDMLIHPTAQIVPEVFFAHAERNCIPFLIYNKQDGSDAVCGIDPKDYQSKPLFTIETDGSHFRYVNDNVRKIN